MATSRLQAFYERLPEGVQPVVLKWYSIVHPGISWPTMRRRIETTEAFKDRFFEDGEFESYRREFLDGRISDICRRGMEEVPEDVSIYDAHQGLCSRTYALIRKQKPETVVETGVYHGVSTVSILLALAENGTGTLYSLHPSDANERPSERAQRADGGSVDEHLKRGRPSCSEVGAYPLPPEFEPGWIIPDDLRENWELNEGWSRRELPRLFEDVGGVDYFFHDSDHSTSGMLFEFELAWDWLEPGGIMASSHVEWNDAFDTFAKEHPCEKGLMIHDYSHKKNEYSTPCSCGYIVKPTTWSDPEIDVEGDAETAKRAPVASSPVS